MAQTTVREGRAVAKWLRLGPNKARRVLDMIRGVDLQEARRRLAFTSLKAATIVSKVLESAVANATNNFELPEDRLYVYRAYADDGVTIKRWRPRAYGRTNRIEKRTSHVTVIVRVRDEESA